MSLRITFRPGTPAYSGPLELTFGGRGARGLPGEASEGGGLEIGGEVEGGTAGRVLYVGVGPVLAEDAGTADLTVGPRTVRGTLTVRQSSGTPGTDEGQISHDGTRLIFRNMDSGGWRFATPAGTQIWNFDGNDTTDLNGYLRVSVRIQAPAIVFGGNSTSPQLKAAANGVVRVEQNNGGPATFASVPLDWSVIGTVNNATPGVARRYRVSGSSTPIVTGMSISQVSGQEWYVVNPDATSVVFKNQDGGSTAANRFICPGGADMTLAQDEEALFWYDAVTSRIRVRKV